MARQRKLSKRQTEKPETGREMEGRGVKRERNHVRKVKVRGQLAPERERD